MRCRYVLPDVIRYDLSEGDWVDLKRALTAGDKWFVQSIHRQTETVDLAASWPAFESAIRLSWIADWSFVDTNGDKTKPTRETLCELGLDTLDELDRTINAHMAAMVAEKNGSSRGSATA
jgi:hypothetical protein